MHQQLCGKKIKKERSNTSCGLESTFERHGSGKRLPNVRHEENFQKTQWGIKLPQIRPLRLLILGWNNYICTVNKSQQFFMICQSPQRLKNLPSILQNYIHRSLWCCDFTRSCFDLFN